ncbi:MAG TPA: sensor histidine kinase [Sulfurimonas autotrophica]|uniref:histidine kinase n=1 Tax=Sulfurimonas autotrophica TaxID=202747 RepID=A0A7C3C3K2_9BACT|nr:sensor histidine kinase [Sulfurimonas autotrophica]
MLKFHQIFLRKFLALFLALFIIVGGIVYYWVYEFYIDATKEALKQDIELLSLQITPQTNLDRLAKTIKAKLHLRVTFIAQDGTVLAESDKDKSKMENHRYRIEIMLADKQAYGSKIRHSHTVNKDLLYVAKKFTLQGKTIYIRLAKEIKGIQANIFSLGMKILAALILFFVAIFTVTYKINTQIEYETGKIVNFLKSLAKKKKSTYIASDYSQEFALITKLLTKVAQIIVKKEKKKNKYTEQLKASNRQKDDIISAISHEFKNPIAIINGYSQTLLEDDDLNINIRKKFLNKIYSNGEKLSNLIDTLRLSMKLDGGHQSITTQKTNLFALTQECAQNLQLSYPHRSVIVEGDKDATVNIDPTLFSIVINNLIENAIKYSEDEVHVIVSAKKLQVKDTGIGISEKDLQNITEKFYRVQQQRWNNSLGLGLFLVNKILNLHNFKLKIESKQNSGSNFIVQL